MDFEDRFRVRPGRRLKLADHDPGDKAGLDKEASEALRAKDLEKLDALQENWKFSAGDVAERAHWDADQRAFEQALAATSIEEAPWYVIPADRKWLMRTAVAAILVHHLEDMDPRFPEPAEEEKAAMREAVAKLREE